MRRPGFVVLLACCLIALGCGSGGHITIRIPTSTPQAAAPTPASGALIVRAEANTNFEIYSADLRTGALINLTRNASTDWQGAFSPDGAHIAFSSMRGGLDDIYIMDPDGSNVRDITNTPDQDESFVSWSPEGGRILYGYFSESTAEYWTMRPDGSDRRLLMAECNDCGIDDWSPDGTEFVGYRNNAAANTNELILLNIDGSGSRVLATSGLGTPNARWSPVGDRIAFTTQSGAPSSTLKTIAPDGSNEQDVFSSASIGQVSWSPDGKSLATSTPEGLVRIDVASGKVTTVAPFSSPYELGVSWSPDGKLIAYSLPTDPGETTNVFVVPADGGTPVDVSNGPWGDYDVAWAPSSRSLLFQSDRDSRDGLYAISPGAAPQRVEALHPNGLTQEQLSQIHVPDTVGACAKFTLESTADSRGGAGCVSPDGRTAAAIRVPYQPGERELVFVNMATHAEEAPDLGGKEPWDSAPVWSPDGSRVAFYATAGGSIPDSALFVLDVSSRDVARVTSADPLVTSPEQSIAWSQDGKSVYFTRGGICHGGCWPGQLFRVGADGTGEERVTDLNVAQVYGFAR